MVQELILIQLCVGPH
jgi:hypothetical protein